MTTIATCWFCGSLDATSYYITAKSHSIERICYYCPEDRIQLTSYETLEEAEEALVRLKMFGEKP